MIKINAKPIANLFAITVFAASLVLPVAASAQVSSTYTPLSPLPCVSADQSGCSTEQSSYSQGSLMTSVDFQGYVKYTFNLIIALAAAAAVFMIVLGGLEYMTTDSWENKNAGLDKAKNAIYGLLLVLASYIILRTINPSFVALPSTLVQQLKLPTNSPTISDLVNQLNSEASQYNPDLQNINSKVQAAYTTINNLTSQQAAIESKISSMSFGDASTVCSGPPPSADIEALCAQRQSIIDKKTSATGDLVTGDIQKVILDSVRACDASVTIPGTGTAAPLGGKDLSCFDNVTQNISTQANQLISQYGSQLSDVQKKQIASYATYAQAFANINKEVELVNQANPSVLGNAARAATGIGVAANAAIAQSFANQQQASITAINQSVAKYQSLPVSDPAMLQQLQTEAQNAIQTIQNMKPTGP